MSVGKLLAMIMAVVIVVLIIVGSSQGWFKPLSEKITSKANEILIMFEKSKPSSDEETDNYCFVENNVLDSKGKYFNRTRCEDVCYLNNSEMLGDLEIDEGNVIKIYYDKTKMNYTYKSTKDGQVYGSEGYTISYLKNVDKELKSTKDLLKILETSKKINDDFKLDKTKFTYNSIDYSEIEDYRFFSNKSFPMYVSLRYNMKEGDTTIEDYIIKYKYDYLLENYYDKLYSLENEVELEKEILNKIDAIAEIIIQDYEVSSIISGLDAIEENTIEKIRSNCEKSLFEIGLYCAEKVRFKDNKEYGGESIFADACGDQIGSDDLNYFILYKCYILIIDGSVYEKNNYFNILSSEFKENIETKNLMIGLYKDEYNVNKKVEADEVLSELNKFKNEIDSVKQIFYNKITKQINDLLNDVPGPQTLSMEEKKESQLSPPIPTNNGIKFKINQTINISDFYAENCGGSMSHIDEGVNVITYGDNYGIIYNSLSKLEKREKKDGLLKIKNCTTNDLPKKNYLVVEYNDKLKQWNLKLDDEYSIDNLKKKIKELTEQKNIYDYSKANCF